MKRSCLLSKLVLMINTNHDNRADGLVLLLTVAPESVNNFYIMDFQRHLQVDSPYGREMVGMGAGAVTELGVCVTVHRQLRRTIVARSCLPCWFIQRHIEQGGP